MTNASAASDRLPRAWPLLFPLTYLVHIVEEYLGGFPAWSSRYLGFRMSVPAFLAINEFAWLGMACAAIAATVAAPARWLVIPLATVTAVNGSGHLVMSGITRTYSPGAVSGTLLWLPLGVVTLVRSYRTVSRGVFWGGVALGLALHALVIGIARAG
jgi:hypothetical protein